MTATTPPRRPPWHGHIAVLSGCIAAAILTTFVLGRDIAWDYLNYHAYAAHALTHPERLLRDFFPAGPQSYLNPIGFAPLAFAQWLGWNTMGIGALLGAIHALNAYFLYLIVRTLTPHAAPNAKAALWLGWLLGATAPVLILTLGSTFVDPIGSVPVLAALWLVLAYPNRHGTLLAGLLMGLAVAIKLSNLVFAVALAMLIALPSRDERLASWAGRVSSGAIGMVAGFALFQGYWSWLVYQVTGNPLFPFFNSIFKSPLFPEFGFGIGRFQPESLFDALALPWRIALPQTWVYVEMTAPTLLPLLTLAAALMLLARRLLRGLLTRPAFETTPKHNTWRLWLFALASWLLWSYTSANGRYGIPLFMLLGPVLATVTIRLLPARYATLSLAVVAAMHLAMLGTNGVSRWGKKGWTPEWFSARVPMELQQEPHLIISLTAPPYASLAPDLHPDSVFVALVSPYSIPASGETGARLKSLIRRHAGRTRLVFGLPKVEGVKVDLNGLKRSHSRLVNHLGLALVGNKCEHILLDRQPRLDTVFNRNLPPPGWHDLVICEATSTPPDVGVTRLRKTASLIMDAFERRCPNLFVPAQPQIDAYGPNWVRVYSNRDATLLTVNFDQDTIRYMMYGQTGETRIGKVSTWRDDLAKFNCRIPGEGKRGSVFVEQFGFETIQ